MTLPAKKSKHIYIFIPSLRGGGAERVAVTLANGAVRQNTKVSLIVATSNSPAYTSEIDQNVTVVHLRVKRTFNALPKLIKLLRSDPPDAFLSIMDHSAVVAQLARTLSRVQRTRFYVRETISLDKKPLASTKPWWRMFFGLVKFSYRNADGVIAPSKILRNSLIKQYNLPANKVTCIVNPAVSGQFTTLKDAKPTIPQPWGRSHLTIISAGRLVEQKDFPTLIHAFAIAKKSLDCKLIILGEGPLRNELEQLIYELGISGDCWMPGFVQNPLPYFKMADIYALTSRQEGLPNALIQALACGTNAVATDCPTGPSEILADVPSAHLIEVGDVDALSGKITDSSTSMKLPKNVLELLHNKYSEKKVTTEYLEYMLR